MMPEESVMVILVSGVGAGAGYVALRGGSPTRSVAKGSRNALTWILLGVTLFLIVAALLFFAALRDLGRAIG